jgi:magnesium transporter
LLINPAFLPIRQVMRPIFHKVTPNTSRDEVVDLVERYNIPALPVTDDDNHLIGVISYEDAVEAMKDIADETIANIAGTGEDFGEHQELFQRLMWRAPWLLVTLCGGLITASAMSIFSDRLWFIIVPFFVPLIAGMSGNIGLQCSTILVRGMATGAVSPGSIREAITKELIIGFLIGTIFGIGCGILIYLLNYLGFHQLDATPLVMGTTVAFGILAASMVATVLGTSSPLLFARWRIDPAVASGPIVTAFNDVLSTLMFFLVARMVYVILT